MCVVSSARYGSSSYLAEARVTWAWGCHDLFQIAHYICSFQVGWMILWSLLLLLGWLGFSPDVPQLDCVWQFWHCLGEIENWQRSAWAKESELMLYGVFTDTTLLNCSERQDNTFFFLALLLWSSTHMLRWDCQSPDSWHDDTRASLELIFQANSSKGLRMWMTVSARLHCTSVSTSCLQPESYQWLFLLLQAFQCAVCGPPPHGYALGELAHEETYSENKIGSVFIVAEYLTGNKLVLVLERHVSAVKKTFWNDVV